MMMDDIMMIDRVELVIASIAVVAAAILVGWFTSHLFDLIKGIAQ
jgi:hypothetical protein